MYIEGFVSFNPKIRICIPEIKSTIQWPNGYILLQKLDYFFPTKFIIGSKKSGQQEDSRLSGISNPDSLFSLSDFEACLSKHSEEIGLGIWYDDDTNVLHLARDIFGMFPLYYIHLPNQFTAFSTNLVKLLMMPLVKQHLSINHQRLTSYLTFRGEQGKDYSADTFYQNVKTVLPGHILSLYPAEIRSKPFFFFQPPQSSNHHSAVDYKFLFRDMLTASVKKNTLQDGLLLGSHLSGGLDSSSVSALTRLIHPDRTLHTFYYSTQKDPAYDQSFAISVARQIGSVHHYVTQETNDFDIVQLHTSLHGYPQPGLISPASQDSLMKCASEAGCKVLLNGSDGDSIVGSGMELPEHTFYEKNWLLLKELLAKRVPFFTLANRYKNWDSLSKEEKSAIVEHNFFYNRLTAVLRKDGVKHAFNTYQELSPHFDLSLPYFLRRGAAALFKKIKGQSIQPVTILKDDFLRDTRFIASPSRGLSASLMETLPDTSRQWLQDVYTMTSISLNESRHILANHYGFQNRSPFYDKQLFELCMSIPPIAKFGNGLGRMHFREAMEGILPEHVRLRHQKTQVGSYGVDVTLRLYDQAKDFFEESTQIWDYVDKKLFNSSVKFLKIKGLPTDQYNRSMFHVTRAISLASWLDWQKNVK